MVSSSPIRFEARLVVTHIDTITHESYIPAFDVHLKEAHFRTDRAQELCKRRRVLSWIPVPNSPYGLCGRKAPLNLKSGNETFLV